MSNYRDSILTGDALTILRTLPSESVQCCVTSPPYYGLRDYGIDGQIGLEETPDEYIAKLVEAFREVRRVLKNDGVLWLNIGDSYAGSMKGMTPDGKAYGGTKQQTNKGSIGVALTDWHKTDLKNKDLIGIPWMLAFALRADGWYLRSDIIWHKPNCMPESVEDRPTKSHEYVFLLSKSSSYYYDADAIREPLAYPERTYGPTSNHKTLELTKQGNRTTGGLHDGRTTYANPLGRNKRSVWIIPTSAYSEAHFATMPTKLVETCILAGSSPGDIVLDPFMGAGTVALVAIQHHRHYVGIELNPEYVVLAEKRIATVQQSLWESVEVAS
jgi:DNA modification methylase